MDKEQPRSFETALRCKDSLLPSGGLGMANRNQRTIHALRGDLDSERKTAYNDGGSLSDWHHPNRYLAMSFLAPESEPNAPTATRVIIPTSDIALAVERPGPAPLPFV